MIEMQVQNIINDFATRISQQGLSMEQYMQFSGATIDSLKEQVRPDAIERIQSSLVLEEIAKAENKMCIRDSLWFLRFRMFSGYRGRFRLTFGWMCFLISIAFRIFGIFCFFLFILAS